jgi:hypothetical protein
MACFLLLVLQAHGLSVADDTATSTLEERYFVFEHDSLGELVESGTAPKKTFQNCLHVGKKLKHNKVYFLTIISIWSYKLVGPSRWQQQNGGTQI